MKLPERSFVFKGSKAKPVKEVIKEEIKTEPKPLRAPIPKIR